MLSGEPFVLEYLQHVTEDIRAVAEGAEVEKALRFKTVQIWSVPV